MRRGGRFPGGSSWDRGGVRPACKAARQHAHAHALCAHSCSLLRQKKRRRSDGGFSLQCRVSRRIWSQPSRKVINLAPLWAALGTRASADTRSLLCDWPDTSIIPALGCRIANLWMRDARGARTMNGTSERLRLQHIVIQRIALTEGHAYLYCAPVSAHSLTFTFFPATTLSPAPGCNFFSLSWEGTGGWFDLEHQTAAFLLCLCPKQIFLYNIRLKKGKLENSKLQ